VDAGGGLAGEARAQHQPVADDLGFRRGFLEQREEVAGQTHGIPDFIAQSAANRGRHFAGLRSNESLLLSRGGGRKAQIDQALFGGASSSAMRVPLATSSSR